MPDYEVFTKEPYETFDIGFDFSRMMKPGATISSIVVRENGSITSSYTENATFSGTIVSVRVKSGSDGNRIKIEFQVIDTNSEKHENGLIMDVVEK